MTQQHFDVDALVGSIATWRNGGARLYDLFVDAGVNQVRDDQVVAAVRSALKQRPDLVTLWQVYSYDKRSTPSPYLDELEVGHYDCGRYHVRRHPTALEACADFLLTEVRWVVDRRVIEPS